jgi:hypothetical protein
MIYETIIEKQKKFCKECVHSCKGCYLPEFAREIAYNFLDHELADVKKKAFLEITLLHEGHKQ